MTNQELFVAACWLTDDAIKTLENNSKLVDFYKLVAAALLKQRSKYVTNEQRMVVKTALFYRRAR